MHLRALRMSCMPVRIFTPNFRLYCLTYEQQSTSRTYVWEHVIPTWGSYFDSGHMGVLPICIATCCLKGVLWVLDSKPLNLACSVSFIFQFSTLSAFNTLSLSIVPYICHGYWCKIFSKFLNAHFCLVTQYSAASHTQVKISSSKCKRKFCKAAGSSFVFFYSESN